MSNFNPKPTDPNRVSTSRDVAQDNQALREQNIAMREQNRAIRENDSAATGLMLGILLLGLAALGTGVYFATQKPTVPPTQTIIRERTNTNTVPTQPQAAPNVNVTVPNPPAPNVNITVPDSTPSSTAPTPAPTLAPPDTSNTAPQSNSSTTTPQTAPANP